MKMTFNKLITPSSTIEVSFDGGLTYTTYDVESCKTNGIVFTEEMCPDLTKISIKGKFKSFSDTVDVVKQLPSDASNIYPSVVLTPCIGYSGKNDFTVVSCTDSELANILSASACTGIYDLYGNTIYRNLNPTDGYLYTRVYVSGQFHYMKIATVTLVNTDRIPVNYFYVSSSACSTYVLQRSRQESSPIEDSYYIAVTDTIANSFINGGYSEKLVKDASGNYYMTESNLLSMSYMNSLSASDIKALEGCGYYTGTLVDETDNTYDIYEMTATKYYIGTIK